MIYEKLQVCGIIDPSPNGKLMIRNRQTDRQTKYTSKQINKEREIDIVFNAPPMGEDRVSYRVCQNTVLNICYHACIKLYILDAHQ